jgi:hypothetical protein
MSLINLQLSQTKTIATGGVNAEIYKALKLIEQKLNELANAKVVPTNNPAGDYRIVIESQF